MTASTNPVYSASTQKGGGLGGSGGGGGGDGDGGDGGEGLGGGGGGGGGDGEGCEGFGGRSCPGDAGRSRGASVQPTSPASVDCTPCGHESSRSAHVWQSVKGRTPTVRVHARGARTASRHAVALCPPARTMHACAQLRNWFEPAAWSLQQKPRVRHSAAHHSAAPTRRKASSESQPLPSATLPCAAGAPRPLHPASPQE